MTHAEFNELMGCTTTTEDFDYANFLYMKAGERKTLIVTRLICTTTLSAK